MDPLNIGIIGMGRIGKIHADNLLRMPRVKLAAVSDLYADEALAQWAAERGVPVATRRSEDLLEDPDIQAVFICSHTDSHVPLIVAAAKAGKHIFCEKPISLDPARTKEALDAVREAGVKLQIGFNRRFDHNFERVRELVRAGRIGEPHLVKITSRDPSPPPEDYIAKSGGIFIDMTIHDFDMARYLIGGDIEEVYARGSVLVDPAFARYGDLDTAVITLKFAGGALGVIDNSRRAVYGYDQRVEVFGSAGSATVENDHPNTAEISTAEGVTRDKPLHFFLERYNEAYVKETRQFAESLLDGADVPVDGNDGLQAELAALAAKWSVRLGRGVKLRELGDTERLTKEALDKEATLA
ncbi:inositol 2-dehydrogenase [Cohnella nanjingensis]|uniref:Inositol 2-dehydrogenase n=1 Tax=Cohnella nanjingensis TaxID=1387779 RepID=A0A7X0VHB0_9BACL|nr:inositol 2-dehydrogenase [Cohnella nanjingensis]MBB6672459.1 inositol 2-dehydrogenase [Cohnella nanjingensis]